MGKECVNHWSSNGQLIKQWSINQSIPIPYCTCVSYFSRCDGMLWSICSSMFWQTASWAILADCINSSMHHAVDASVSNWSTKQPTNSLTHQLWDHWSIPHPVVEQWIDQLSKQASKQPDHQRSTHQATMHLANQTINQSINRSINQASHRSINQSINRAVNRLISPSTNQCPPGFQSTQVGNTSNLQ